MLVYLSGGAGVTATTTEVWREVDRHQCLATAPKREIAAGFIASWYPSRYPQIQQLRARLSHISGNITARVMKLLVIRRGRPKKNFLLSTFFFFE